MKIQRQLLVLMGVMTISLLALGCSHTETHTAKRADQHGLKPVEAPPSTSTVQETPVEATQEQARTLDEAEASETFETAWRLMRDAGALSDMSDADWEALRERYVAEADAARTDEALRVVLDRMIKDLGKSHFAVIPKQATQMPSPDSAAEGNVGLEARVNDHLVYVTKVIADSPAEEAGVQPGWRITSIGGFELAAFSERFGEISNASMSGYHRNAALASMLGVAPGQTVPFEFIDASGEEQRLELTGVRSDAKEIKFGNLPPMSVSTRSVILDQGALQSYGLDVPEDYSVGLLQFSVWMIPIVQPIRTAVDQFRRAGVDAVVIDLRGNPGGVGGLAMGVGGHFTDEPVNLGTMYNDFGEINFNTNPQRVAPDGRLVEPLQVPLAILVDSMSASTSEIFAGGMQVAKRAAIIGRQTPGMALPAVAESLPNGDILYHAIAEFELPDGSFVEGEGITPDQVVPLDAASFERSRDPDLRTAVEWMTRTTEKSDR